MKSVPFLLLTLVSFSALADRNIDLKIRRLQSANDRGEIQALSASEKDIMSRGLNQALSVLRDEPRRPDPRPQPPRYGTNTVIAYSDDSCQSIVTEIRNNDNCAKLSAIFGNTRVWSVSVNDQCYNIPDSTFPNMCHSLLNLSEAPRTHGSDITTYTDDSCQAKLVDIDGTTDCKALNGVLSNFRIWSVSMGGKCVNIPDTTFTQVSCQNFQTAGIANSDNRGRRGEPVELFTDDSCYAPLLTVQKGIDCRALSPVYENMRVWSIRYRGQCVNIQDTTFGPACEAYSR